MMEKKFITPPKAAVGFKNTFSDIFPERFPKKQMTEPLTHFNLATSSVL